MPIYEYQCKQCGSHFEKRQAVGEEPAKSCEKCGGELEKQWSLSGFQFKGEGWYVTDYAAKKSGGDEAKQSADAKSAAEKTTGGESTTASDSASKPSDDKIKTPKPAPAKESGPSKE